MEVSCDSQYAGTEFVSAKGEACPLARVVAAELAAENPFALKVLPMCPEWTPAVRIRT
jgi:hypothetical protein